MPVESAGGPMALAGYLAAIKRVIQIGVGETKTYTDDLLTEGLRQALREYQEAAAPRAQRIEITETGHAQSLAAVIDLQEVVLIAYPWEATDAAAAGVDLRSRIVRWRQVIPGTIWIEGYEPRAGEYMLVYYRMRQGVEDLDGAIASTVPVELESLVTLGAAAWATELHYRGLGEAIKGPNPEQVKRMYTWSYLRLAEFRNGLRDLSRAGAVVAPAWGRIGL